MGGQATSAYVPWHPNNVEIKNGAISLDTTPAKGGTNLGGSSASDVTIGTGVDLGQQDPAVYLARLKAAGASQALMDKLKPYIGRRRAAACKYLRANPLNITKEEADFLDEEMKNDRLKEIKRKYDDLTQGIKDRREFKDLSTQEQTVLFSRHYQDGNIHKTHTQFVVADMASGNIDGAISRLNTKNYPLDAHETRIAREYNYIHTWRNCTREGAEAGSGK